MNNKTKERIILAIVLIASFILGLIPTYISNILSLVCIVLLLIYVVVLEILENRQHNKNKEE
jgi:hypothetical protein